MLESKIKVELDSFKFRFKLKQQIIMQRVICVATENIALKSKKIKIK